MTSWNHAHFQILEATRIPCWVVDRQLQLQFSSSSLPALLHSLRCSQAGSSGNPAMPFGPAQAWDAAYRQAFAGEPARMSLPSPDMEAADCLISLTPLRSDPAGMPEFVVVSITHSTPQQIEHKFQQLLEAQSDIFYRFVPGSGGAYYSPQTAAILGYTPQELYARPMLWHDSVHAEDRYLVDEAITALAAHNTSFDIEYRIRTKSGNWCWLRDRSVSHVVDDSGALVIDGMATDITRAKAQQTRTVRTRDLLEEVLSSIDTAVLLVDRATASVGRCNARATEVFACSAEELTGMPLARLVLGQADWETWLTRPFAAHEPPLVEEDTLLCRANGDTFPAQVSLKSLPGQLGDFIVVSVHDLTLRYTLQTDLDLARRVIENASEAIVITDASNRIVRVNAAFTRITGWDREEVIGRNPSILSSGQQGPSFYHAMWKTLQQEGMWQGEILNRRKSGEFYPEWLNISTIVNRHGEITNFLAIFSDITERKRTEGLIHKYAFYDNLTDLPNKALLLDRIAQAITRAQKQGKAFYLIALNINRLKQVNDSLGHRIGDEVIKEMGRRILACTRDGDTVSRIGGDDFIVLLPWMEDSRHALELAERMINRLDQPIEIEGHLIHITVNAGITAYPLDGDEPELLLRNADAALNHARHEGQGRAEFFKQRMNAEVTERMLLETELRAALNQKQFQLYYQPQFDLASQRVCGVEALLRWNRPEGQVSPAQFIPVLEELGLIIPVGDWILHEACRQLRQWREQGQTELVMAVNLSTIQFRDPNLIERVRSALIDSGIPPSRLELEVTESMAMHDPQEVLNTLHGLQQLGVLIAIDDFGTGYSSLSYLRRFPVDKLKIDQAFVRDMVEDAEARSIVGAVIGMAHGLGLRTIAEGVETEAQKQALHDLGCHEIQGYLISRPRPAQQLFDAGQP